jgi:spore maturation protein CgeB
MKILFSGYHNPHYETVTEYMERALRALGQEVIVYDDRRHIIPGRIRSRCGWLNRLDLACINHRLVEAARQEAVDAVVVTGGDRILAETVKSIRSMGITTALWTTDPPRGSVPILRAAPFYDHVFCQGTEFVDLLREHGIDSAQWLPVGCDPERHHTVELTDDESRQYGSDVVFVGSHYPEREALFESLADFDLALWGPGWDRLRTGSPLRHRVRKAHTVPSEWLRIYSASRIVLATHWCDPDNRFPVHQASPRVFEVLACGAFLIADRQRDILSLFKDEEHLVGFDGAEDLRSKIRYYLDHPEERLAIARKGREEAAGRHRYVDRLGKLLSVLNGCGHAGK